MSGGKRSPKLPSVDTIFRNREARPSEWGYLVPSLGVRYYVFLDGETEDTQEKDSLQAHLKPRPESPSPALLLSGRDN